MCELDAAAIISEEIANAPKRRRWYAIVGTEGDAVIPRSLTEAREVAAAHAVVANADYPLSGPWYVVELLENLQVTV